MAFFTNTPPLMAMTTSSQSAALVTTVVRLAEALSLQIVAEGLREDAV